MSDFRDIDPVSLWTMGLFVAVAVLLGFVFLR